MREDAPAGRSRPTGDQVAAEHLGRLYERGLLAVVSLRYFTVYGRGSARNGLPNGLDACRDGRAISLYGDGEQTRDFTYIADAVSATRRAGESGRPGCVYNVGGGERVSVNEVLRKIADITGRAPEVKREGEQRGDMRDTFADTAAARRDLGFRSTVTLSDGLAAEWQWLSASA